MGARVGNGRAECIGSAADRTIGRNEVTNLTRSTTKKVWLLIIIVVASAAAASLHTVIQASTEVNLPLQAMTGATIGAVVAFCIVGFELFVAGFLLEHDGNRMPLALALLVRTAIYGFVILTALLFFPWLFLGAELSLFRPGIAGDVVSSFVATFVLVSLISIAQLIGPSVLAKLLTGQYHRPREEERIVLFLDLTDSTAIAERIGNIRFHALLAETFTCLSRVVTDMGGEVYRYVGDELIATWPVAKPADNARPILCLFLCREALGMVRPQLLRRYGVALDFRAGLHLGTLVVGEVGGFKREITLIGEAMNTAARIEQVCRNGGHTFLVSSPLLQRASLPRDAVVTSTGSHFLRGKMECLELYAVEQRTAAPKTATRFG
jgi:adenylate cyclase